MIKAPLPNNEVQRIEALRQYQALDTTDEPAFDELTRLAALLCGTPTALICLVDKERCLALAKVGWTGLSWARDRDFCAYAILQEGAFIVPDALNDERFATHPLVVAEPYIRFYAGIPLIAKEGCALGCLCAIDRVPRTLTPAQIEALQMLASQVMLQLDSRKRLAQLKTTQTQLQNLLDKANVLIQTVRLEDQSFLYINQGWRQTLGYKSAEVGQMSMWDVLHPEYREQYRVQLEKLRLGESIENVELIFLTKAGEPVWVEGNVNGRWKNGQLYATRWIFQNVSDRKYRQIVEHAAIGLFQLSPEGRYLTVNPALAKIYGYDSATEFLESVENISQLCVDPSHWTECLRQLEASDRVRDLETEVYRRDGSAIWISETMRLLRDARGLPLEIEGSVKDLTTRKQAEATLQMARDQLQAVLDAVPGSVSLISSNFRYLGVNRHLADTYNLPVANFVGREVGFLQPGFTQFVRDFFEGSDEEVCKEIDTDVNGTLRSHLMMAKKWLASEAGVFVGIDISDRKQAEANLQLAMDQLQAVLDAVPGTVSLISSNFRYLGVNRHLASIYNLLPEYFINREVGFHQSEFGKFVREFFLRPIEEASREIDTEVNGIFRSDMVIAKKWQEDKAVFVGIDITQRKQAEAALQAELGEAAEYVRSLLPHPLTKPVAIDSRFIPSTQVGGDCFDYYWLDDRRLAIYLLDVSGHGSRAALLSVSLLNILRSRFLPNTDFYQPSKVLEALNQGFQMDTQRNMYFTIWYGVYDRSKRQLVYANAGHPPAILLSPDAQNTKVKLLKNTGGLPIGMFPSAKYNNNICNVQDSSILYVFSDGVYEIMQTDGTIWGLDPFINWLASSSQKNSFSLDVVLNYVRTLSAKGTFDDDVSLLEVKFSD